MRSYTKAVQLIESVGQAEELVLDINEQIIALTSKKETLSKEKRTVLAELKSMGIIVKEVI